MASDSEKVGSEPHRKTSTDEATMVEQHSHIEDSGHSDASPTAAKDVSDMDVQDINRQLDHPLAHFSLEELSKKGEAYAVSSGFTDAEDIRAFKLGAMIAKDDSIVIDEQQYAQHASVLDLTEEELHDFRLEDTNKWHHPFKMYLVIILCSLCAAVQGMDETVVNGAQLFYAKQFGIDDKENQRETWLLGLVNSAPYLCCAVIGCWLTIPLNNWFGRRNTVFITCAISALACFWQAFTNSWWHMFIARFALGFGIGPKSATVPMYAAECAPKSIRGALVMQWQVWTAFGIMVGYAADLAFLDVSSPHVIGLNWRIMMASALLPAVIVCAFVYNCPESPRWYVSKGNHTKAWASMQRLRFQKVQAARDLFYIQYLVALESKTIHKMNKVQEMIKVPRNRRAMLASEIVMFMQQFCGVNVIAYYSSAIFSEAGFDDKTALGASMGFGVINWLFALPAFFTIDKFGRRNLLLTTFPLMSLCLFFAGFSFLMPFKSTGYLACIPLGIYLFGIVYSPGEGPVPFTYSAEAYPLYIRAQGMSLATATTWFFNFILSVTWPSLVSAFTPTGAFSWYAGWNIIGFFAVLFFVPETKDKTLEELDYVFSISTRDHAAWGLKSLVWFLRRWVLWQRGAEMPVLPRPRRNMLEPDVEGKRGMDMGEEKIVQG